MTPALWPLLELAATVAVIITLGSWVCMRAGFVLSTGWTLWILASLSQADSLPVALLLVGTAWGPWLAMRYFKASANYCSLGNNC